jgi:hypothetical protein
MSKHLPPRPNLKQLKIQAKDLRKATQVADAESIRRLKAHLLRFSNVAEDEIRDAKISLKDCQHVVAREYGFESWNWLQTVVDVDFDLLNRLGDGQLRILLPEVDNPEWMTAFHDVDDPDSLSCPEGLMARVLGLMTQPLRAHIIERMALQESITSSQVLAARRLILTQANLLAVARLHHLARRRAVGGDQHPGERYLALSAESGPASCGGHVG